MTAKFFGGPGSVWSTPVPADAPIAANSADCVADLTALIEASPEDNWYMARFVSGSSRIYTVNNSTPKVAVYLNEPEGTYVTPSEFGSDFPWLAWVFREGVPVLDSFESSHPADYHMIIYNEDTHEMWDFWHMWKDDIEGAIPAPGGPYGRWIPRWGGYYNNVQTHSGMPMDHSGTDGFHTEHWKNGAVASSLPLAGGMILEEELIAGVIPHALQMQVGRGNSTPVWPAQRSDLFTDSAPISEGTRFRLKPTFDIDTITFPFSAQGLRSAKMIATAAQTYGIIVNDFTGFVQIRSEWPQSDIDYYDYGGNLAHTDEGIPDILFAALPLDQLEVVDPSWRPDGFPPAWDSGGSVSSTGWRVGSL